MASECGIDVKPAKNLHEFHRKLSSDSLTTFIPLIGNTTLEIFAYNIYKWKYNIYKCFIWKLNLQIPSSLVSAGRADSLFGTIAVPKTGPRANSENAF